jgi:hypothetical protein
MRGGSEREEVANRVHLYVESSEKFGEVVCVGVVVVCDSTQHATKEGPDYQGWFFF